MYVAGGFYSPIVTFGSTTLTNAGIDSTDDVFLVKYDTMGNVIWAKSYGGNSYDAATNATTDVAGNVYMAGAFSSNTITFGSTILTRSTGNDMFLVKYDSSGNVIWAKSAGSNDIFGGDVDASSVMIDVDGNIYIAGNTSCDGVVFSPAISINSGGGAMFLVKYSASGNVIWAKAAQANLYTEFAAIDTMDHIYVAGSFSGSISFGSISLTGLGGYDIFLAKYDTAGNVISAEEAGTTNNEFVNSVTTDLSGNVYISGKFNGPSITFGATTLTNAGSPTKYNTYMVKYDSSGNTLWAKSAVGAGDFNTFNSIVTDNTDNVYMGGAYNTPTAVFGNDTLNNQNPGSFAVFVTKYDTSGNDLWAVSANGMAIVNSSCIAINASGQVYFTGSFSSTISLGITSLTGGGDQYFLARLDSAYNPDAEVPVVAGSSKNITLYPNPNDGQMTVALNAAGYNTLQVYDCLGNRVYATALNGTETTTIIDLHTLPAGVYYLHAVSRSNSENVAFVVER